MVNWSHHLSYHFAYHLAGRMRRTKAEWPLRG